MGKQVIAPTDLEDASEHYAETDSADGKSVKKLQRDRDIKMRLKSGETLKLLAVENQSQVDYAMPFRCMQYDAMEYEQQLKELRKRNREKGGFATDGEFLCGVRKNTALHLFTPCACIMERNHGMVPEALRI